MQNRLIQIGLSVALGAILVQMVLIAPSQIRDAEHKAALLPTPEMTNAEGVDQSMRGLHMIETREGAKEWELWSEQAISIKAKELLELDVVRAIFFSDSGVTFTVTGSKGSVQIKSKDLRVQGDVVVRSSNGYVFRTQVVEYFAETRKLQAPGEVEMQGPRDGGGQSLRLVGHGMDASLEEGTMTVLSDVKAQKKLEKGRTALIKSQRATFSGKQASAEFKGDVVLDVDNMRITGPAAHFEYDRSSNMVKSVVFSGGARFSDMDKWATAKDVRVDFDRNRFVFRGSPRVVQGNDELRGEEIILLDGGKQVLVQRARARVDEKRLEKN